MTKSYVDMLVEMAKEVFSTVNPLLGKAKSGENVGSERGFGGDRTKYIDAVSEKTIVDYLERKQISCIFIGEERGARKIGEKPEFYLIVDGVDGTTNAVRGIRFASTSMAISPIDRLSGLEAATVMNLDNGGIYVAERGNGAYYEGRRIRTSETSILEEAILGIDMSRVPEAVEKMVPLMKSIKSIRSFGSAALEICFVASGLLDAYVDVRGKLRTVDIAAGMLILKEAGGLFLKPNGEEIQDAPLTKMAHFSLIAAANRSLFEKIASIIPT